MVIPAYQSPGYGHEAIPTGTQQRPGVKAFLNHLIATYPGSSSLGIYNNRSIRNGTSKSLHAVSRAFDWRYADRGDAEEVMEALTGHGGSLAVQLGVQAIHDYAQTDTHGLGHTWGHGRGWHYGHIGSGGSWLHIELQLHAAENATLMSNVMLGDDHTEPDHDADHADHVHQVHTARSVPVPYLRRGDHNGEVRMLQDILANWHDERPDWVPSNVGLADGIFGRRTESALREFQLNVLHTAADGIYGPASHHALDDLARFLAAQ